MSELIAIIKDVMNPPDIEITEATRLNEDLKADSLDKVSMLMQLEETFPVEIDDDKALQFKTVGDVYEYLKAYNN
ncbi:MAG: acyl carrier protein [Clostridia bacterium]|nr:acyl carrier protein [Clostridia bacterium]